jgi:hypothetical protein
MFHCPNCDTYFNADRLQELPSGLPIHRCGHVPQRLSQAQTTQLTNLATRRDRLFIERIFQCY